MMPSEDRNAETLTGFWFEYRYILTVISMAVFALVLKLYAEDEMKLAIVTLGLGILILSFKTYLIRSGGESVIKQIEQWLFEFAVILVISGFSSSSLNPVFGAVATFFGVLFMLIFTLLAIRKLIN